MVARISRTMALEQVSSMELNLELTNLAKRVKKNPMIKLEAGRSTESSRMLTNLARGSKVNPTRGREDS